MRRRIENETDRLSQALEANQSIKQSFNEGVKCPGVVVSPGPAAILESDAVMPAARIGDADSAGHLPSTGFQNLKISEGMNKFLGFYPIFGGGTGRKACSIRFDSIRCDPTQRNVTATSTYLHGLPVCRSLVADNDYIVAFPR